MVLLKRIINYIDRSKTFENYVSGGGGFSSKASE